MTEEGAEEKAPLPQSSIRAIENDVHELLSWRHRVSHASCPLRQPKQSARHVVSVQDIADELGMTANAEVVDIEGKGQRFLEREILGRRTPYVALLPDGRLQGLVDRAKLAERVCAGGVGGA